VVDSLGRSETLFIVPHSYGRESQMMAAIFSFLQGK
jgi:hypothetical protein